MQLFVKPKDMTYTDMCIWIDENFYKEDCDFNTAYKYMYLIAYMLACKAKYFTTKEDYEEFAAYLAYSTYKRMIDDTKSQIKSVLNYMKSIISWRKGAFNEQKHQEIIDPEYDNFDSVLYTDSCRAAYESQNHEILVESVLELLHDIPLIVKKCIPKVYKGDKVISNNLYISALLSLLDKFTLEKQFEDKLQEKLDTSPTFNEVSFYKRHLEGHVIRWHLSESMEPVIMVIMNKVSSRLIDEIKGLTEDTRVTENDFNSIMASGFATGGVGNETGS